MFKINFGIQRNIFLTEFDSIKIGDFGQSRQIDSTIDTSSHEGTFQYMSPEVRARHSEYFFNTDCWSLGCVLYELITLKRFHREDRIETNDVIQREITDLKTLNLFEILLSKMLIVEKGNRAESERLKEIFDENELTNKRFYKN